MRFRWPADTVFNRHILEVEQDSCSVCCHRLHVCDHRPHRIFTLQGPVELLCKLAHCPAASCPAHSQTLSPQAELLVTLPGWLLGWDVFCWLGHRRFARHWSVPQLRWELADSYRIPLSADAIEVYLRRYQTMLAARQQDGALLAREYAAVDKLILSIDGLQPEKGHETLYVIRELQRKRVWFAEALLSSTAAEIGRLLQQAKDWATRLGKPIELWLSDKQDAFVTGIASLFPDILHRYCSNHFLRDLAKPILESDSHAKVQMRRKVRGLRAIERAALQELHPHRPAAVMAAATPPAGPANSTRPLDPVAAAMPPAGPANSTRPLDPVAAVTPPAGPANSTRPLDPVAAVTPPAGPAYSIRPLDLVAAVTPPAGPANSIRPLDLVVVATPPAGPANSTTPVTAAVAVVLDYCAAVRGILNDDQGGPLHPPGLRMADALREVQASLQRNVEAKKGGAHTTC